MKLAIMQPYFLPYIGYWQLMNEVDHFVFYDDVNFIKRGYINRNNILITGNSKGFNIPLKAASQNRMICEIEIDNSQRWKQKLLNTIFLSYKKALHFDLGFNLIEEILKCEKQKISELVVFSANKISSFLEMDTKVSISSNLDYNRELKGQLKILELCKKIGANHYINPIGGMEIYENNLFIQEKIKLNFLKTNTISYPQYGSINGFVSNLSIIDVIMNNSVEEIKELLTQFQLAVKS